MNLQHNLYILRKKSIWMPWSMCFVDIKCSKFWSIWLEHFVECKHLIYEECGPGTFWNKTGLQDGAAWVLHGRCVGGPTDRWIVPKPGHFSNSIIKLFFYKKNFHIYFSPPSNSFISRWYIKINFFVFDLFSVIFA